MGEFDKPVGEVHAFVSLVTNRAEEPRIAALREGGRSRKGLGEMLANRNPHLGAIGLVVTVGLLLVLAVQVGVTDAATSTSDASSKAAQGEVTIHLWGPGLGPSNPAGHGLFTISGVISDEGSFVDDLAGEPGRGIRVLRGAKGKIRVTIGHFGFWTVTKGTRAYAGLHGRGTGGNLSHGNQGPVGIWMTGTVSH